MAYFERAIEDFSGFLMDAARYFDPKAGAGFRGTVGFLIKSLEEEFAALPKLPESHDNDFDGFLASYDLRPFTDSEQARFEKVFALGQEILHRGDTNHIHDYSSDAEDAIKRHPRYLELHRLRNLPPEEKKAAGLTDEQWVEVESDWYGIHSLKSASRSLKSMAKHVSEEWKAEAHQVTQYRFFLTGEDFGFMLGLKFLADLSTTPEKFGFTAQSANFLLVKLMNDPTYRASFIAGLAAEAEVQGGEAD